MIGLIGGTGPEGTGLALRFAFAGESVLIGSRSEERARAAAERIRLRLARAKVDGAENATVAAEADLLIVTVPFSGQAATLESLRDRIGDRIVIDAVVPLRFGRGFISVLLVEEGSAAQQAQRILPRARVVAAFLNLSAELLAKVDSPLEDDVIVCGDDASAKQTAMALIELIPGVRALDGGRLANARHLEQVTALLLTLNRIYRTQTGIKVTGI